MVRFLPRPVDVLRKAAFAFPFGCLTALLSHEIRFGDDHAFGREANQAIVSAAIVGWIAIAGLIFHAFLTAGSTTVTGTIARSRAARLLPNAPSIFTLAAVLYYCIETLEGNGIELGWPTVVLAAIATLLALGLRCLCDELARFVQAIVCEFVALLSARPFASARPTPQPHPLCAQVFVTARRFGRAPPNERRFS
jgi:hypothetical protein